MINNNNNNNNNNNIKENVYLIVDKHLKKNSQHWWIIIDIQQKDAEWQQKDSNPQRLSSYTNTQSFSHAGQLG